MEPKVKADMKKPDADFPIVGIGASAGGLYSLQCFISAIPRDFGFAIVFMQHLSAKHRSLLPELLHNRKPDMKIEEISDGLEVSPGKLFLCPPGQEVRLDEGIFHLVPPSQDHVHLPIDEFFISLAEDVRDRAIAVIFSGAGTDGARGIQAIRDSGGTVFVQDPATAEFPGMPTAAVATGRADSVLPPNDIAQEILKLHGVLPPAGENDITPTQFGTFSRLIHEKTGYHFNHYKKGVVSRRIKRRMYLRGVPTVDDYIKMIDEKDSEAAGLAADLMIGVTSFFRDRLAWKALRIEVIRSIVAADDDQPIRVWTPACATGEEAYSIAMMLRHELDLAGRKREIQVFATDVNDFALERAREGKYPGSIAADVSPDYMKKFFACSEDGLSVIIGKEIRESVVFARQDLLADPPFSRLDLVICRNLLIYLELEAQEKCIAIFHYALRDGGYLFLGNAESTGRNKDLFRSLGHKKCRVYQKIGVTTSSRLSLSVPLASGKEPAFPSKQARVAENRQSLVEFIQENLLEEYAPAAVAIDQSFEILYHNGPTNRYLTQPRGGPTQNLLELLPGTVRNRIRGAIYRTAQGVNSASARIIIPDDNGRKRLVTLRISRLRDNFFLVVFRQRAGKKSGFADESGGTSVETSVDENVVRQLESELSATRDELQSNIEQLKSLNEELQSSNEELQAANEELETSREELQSLNEELITVNSQLQSKIEEQEETNNDLHNFLASTNIPTVFLDHQLRVKRFTPAMSRLIKLIPGDVGRPIVDMSRDHLGPDLRDDARRVLDHLSPLKKEFRIVDTWYIRSILPYRTSDNRIEGVVITYTDTSDLKRAEERTRHLASFPQLDPNPVIEVDSSGNVIFLNRATQEVLEKLGLDKKDCSAFLPADFEGILKGLANKEEGTFSREVTVKTMIFGESVHLVPQSDAVRIYAFDITERKRDEEMRGRLSALVQSAEDAIISKDFDGVIQTWNVGAEKIFGYTAEEVIGKNISLLIPPGHVDEVPGILRRIAKGEHIERYETERMRKDGKIIPVSLTYSPIRDAGGRIVAVSKIAHDISERKKAEEQLIRAKGQWERTFASVPDMIAIIDNDHRVVRVNESMARRLGCSPEECVGKKCYEAVHGTTAPHAFCPHTRTLKDHSGHVEEVHEERLGLDLLVTTTPLFDERGEMIGSVHVAHDITGRKRAEQALRQSEEQFRTLADAIPQLCWTADSEGYLTWYNRRWYEYTGTTPGQMEGWGWQMVHDPEVLPKVMEQWKESIATGEPFEMEFPLRRADGKFRTFLTRTVPVKDSEGRVLKWFGTNTDISELKTAELELHRLNRTLRALSDSSQAIIRAKDESGYMDEVCRIIVEDCGYVMVWIGFAENNAAKSVHPVAHAGFEEGYLETLQVSWSDTDHGHGPTGTAIRTGEAAVCRNMLTDPAFSPWREEALRRGYASSIAFPLMRAGEAFGAITIYAKEADPFSIGEMKLLGELADNLSYGIEVLHIRALQKGADEALKKSLGRFELLTVTAGELLQSTEPQKVVESVCRKVMEHLNCDAFFNFLVDEEAGRLHLNAWAGIPEEEAERIEWLDFGVAVCGCAARDASRIVAEHIPTTGDERTQLVKTYGINAYCCHPLFGPGGKVIGTLSFGTCNRETFSEEDLSLMKAVADQVAVAMIRMRNEADIIKLGEDMVARNVELESVNKELESFIYSISHDLRAPLRSMGGFARILAEDYAESLDDPARDYLGRIIKGSEKMTLLIDDLLHLSRISREQVGRTRVDMSVLAATVVSGLREADPQREVEVHIAPDLTALADPRLMEIVLSNLLSNAWKFTSKTANSRIEFGALEEDGDTVFYVRDNGAGFDPQYMNKMFSPFQRLHSDNEYEGTGIGLTIVERIIGRHRGKVWAEGGVGQGAAVYFTVGKN